MQLPKNYQDYGDVFNELKANTLPEFWLYDCPINLQPIKEPPWGANYNFPPTVLEVFRTYIKENMANGFIWNSKFQVGASIFCEKKTRFTSSITELPWFK